eukprot:scaffold54879_cov68-Phaeocystis_antarctica.AAC.8
MSTASELVDGPPTWICPEISKPLMWVGGAPLCNWSTPEREAPGFPTSQISLAVVLAFKTTVRLWAPGPMRMLSGASPTAPARTWARSSAEPTTRSTVGGGGDGGGGEGGGGD